MIKELLDEFHVPLHVRRHSEKVAELCEQIATELISKGIEIDLDLLLKAAHLHDMLRIVDFTTWNPENFPDPNTQEDRAKWDEIRAKYAGKRHEKAAGEVLRSRGHVKLAELIESHRFSNILNGLDTWEQKILFYADKRVEGDQIVSLKERLEKGKERNAITPEQKRISEEAESKVVELEGELVNR